MSVWTWVGLAEALAIHEVQLAQHGGGIGIRDLGLLESALARPQNLHAYQTADVHTLAAAYTAGILQNHPFVDGNKRTGFIVGVLFLELNGHLFFAEEAEAAQAVLELAAGDLDEEAYQRWLQHVSRRTET